MSSEDLLRKREKLLKALAGDVFSVRPLVIERPFQQKPMQQLERSLCTELRKTMDGVLSDIRETLSGPAAD